MPNLIGTGFHFASTGTQCRRFDRLKFGGGCSINAYQALLKFGIGFLLKTPRRFKGGIQRQGAVEFSQSFPVEVFLIQFNASSEVFFRFRHHTFPGRGHGLFGRGQFFRGRGRTVLQRWRQHIRRHAVIRRRDRFRIRNRGLRIGIRRVLRHRRNNAQA